MGRAVILDIAHTVDADERSRKQQAFESSPTISQIEPSNDLYTRLVDNGDG